MRYRVCIFRKDHQKADDLDHCVRGDADRDSGGGDRLAVGPDSRHRHAALYAGGSGKRRSPDWLFENAGIRGVALHGVLFYRTVLPRRHEKAVGQFRHPDAERGHHGSRDFDVGAADELSLNHDFEAFGRGYQRRNDKERRQVLT